MTTFHDCMISESLYPPLLPLFLLDPCCHDRHHKANGGEISPDEIDVYPRSSEWTCGVVAGLHSPARRGTGHAPLSA